MALAGGYWGREGPIPRPGLGGGEAVYQRGLQQPGGQQVMAGLGRVATAVDSMVPFTPGFSMPLGLGMYHGTPHKWAPEPEFPKGRFKLDKIGTGEGAQAYGHGAYFAESPGVANDYARKLTKRGAWTVDGEPVEEIFQSHWEQPLKAAAEEGDVGLKRFIKDTNERIERRGKPGVPFIPEEWYIDMLDQLDIAENLVGKKVAKQTGNTYSLDIPVEDVPLLDWDLPLSEQPKILGVLKKGGAYIEDGATGRDVMKGKTLRGVSDANGVVLSPEEFLRKNGIPGLRYKDAMSRGGEGGTRNYVIWDQDLLDRAKHIE